MWSYYWLVLFCLIAVPLTSLATLLNARWEDVQVRHTWETVPGNWEIMGAPLAGSTIDIRIALKPHRDNALIEALYKVSSPDHPKQVSPSLLCAHRLTSTVALVQLSCAPVPGPGL